MPLFIQTHQEKEKGKEKKPSSIIENGKGKEKKNPSTSSSD